MDMGGNKYRVSFCTYNEKERKYIHTHIHTYIQKYTHTYTYTNTHTTQRIYEANSDIFDLIFFYKSQITQPQNIKFSSNSSSSCIIYHQFMHTLFMEKIYRSLPFFLDNLHY